jgi:hypothetical protein
MAFIKIDRNFFEGKYWKQKRVFSQAEAWIDLVRTARFEIEPETRILSSGRYITIKRGEIHASIRFLAERWSWGTDKVKRFLDAAISEQAIERRTEQGESIITLLNYGIYNPTDDESQTPNRTPNRTPIDTPTKHPSIHQPNTRKYKLKNIRTKEYKKYILSEINSDDFPELNNEYLEITKAFHSLFRNNLIEAGASTTIIDRAKGTWVDSIRLMIEADGYTVEDLRDVYKFLQKDAFWKQNILSTSKLREQMHKIKLKIKNGNSKTREATSWEELAEVVSSFAD